MESQHFGMNQKKENEYPKLVRDNIPEIVEELTGKKTPIRILEDDMEYLGYLLQKIEEEASELANAEGRDHQTQEIADVLEVLEALVDLNELDWDEIREIQREKRQQRGGFEKRILMLEKV